MRVLYFVLLAAVLPGIVSADPVERILTYYNPDVPGHYHAEIRHDCYAAFFELRHFSLPDSLLVKGIWINSGMYGEIKVSLSEDDTTQEWDHFPGDTVVTVWYYDPGGTPEDTVMIGGIEAAKNQSFWVVIEYVADGVPFNTSATSPPEYRNLLRRESNGLWSSDIDDWSLGLLVVHEPVGISGNEPLQLPKAFALRQNFPNPFNPSTTIAFDLEEKSCVSLCIYSTRGIVVRHLIENKILLNGSYQVHWDGKDNGCQDIPSGIYIYKLRAGEEAKIMKMVLLK